MFNHLESLGTQESPVKVDLLHLDPVSYTHLTLPTT